MNKVMKAAVIGCGSISGNHLKAVKQLKDTEVVALCDTDIVKARETAEQYGVVGVYDDYRSLLDNDEIDVVHICTPHWLHAQMAIDSLQAGKHVLCEKPMALSTADALRMIAARDQSQRQLAVCLQNRYNESAIYLKTMLEQGHFGAVLGARGQVTWCRKPEYYTNSDWRGRWATEGGGVLINQAIHTLDLLQWLTGEVRAVTASIATNYLHEVIEVEDTADIYMEGVAGARILFYATNCYVSNAPVELEIICENGCLKLIGNQVYTNQNGRLQQHDFSSGAVLGKDYWGSGHGVLIEDFYRCLRNNDQFQISGEAALVSVRLLEAIYRSGQIGQRVEL